MFLQRKREIVKEKMVIFVLFGEITRQFLPYFFQALCSIVTFFSFGATKAINSERNLANGPEAIFQN